MKKKYVNVFISIISFCQNQNIADITVDVKSMTDGNDSLVDMNED